jgi:hypothetical protein
VRFTIKSSLYRNPALTAEENVNEGEDVSPVDGFTKSLKYLALRQESSVPYTPIKDHGGKGSLRKYHCKGSTGKSMSATSTFNTMGGGTSMHMEPTRSIERTQSILRNVQAVERGRVGVRQSRQRSR